MGMVRLEISGLGASGRSGGGEVQRVGFPGLGQRF